MRPKLLAPFLLCLSVSLPVATTGQSNIAMPTPMPAAAPAAVAKRDRPLRIVTTTGVLADVTRRLAGDLAVVTSMVPPGADLHTFEPTPDAVRELAGADLVIVNGLGLEGWLEKVVANSGYKGPVVVASNGVSPIKVQTLQDIGHGHDHTARDPGVMASTSADDGHDHDHHDHNDHGGMDPHAWTDVMAVATYAANIREALVAADGYNVAEYEARGELYAAQLKVLHNWILRETSKLAPEQRILVMDHDAMAYFAQRYGFTVRTVRGASTREEPDAHGMGEVAEFMRQNKVRSVYIEQSGNARLIESLTRETGARLGEPLLVHAPAPAGEPGDTYIEMMMLNVFRVVRGAR